MTQNIQSLIQTLALIMAFSLCWRTMQWALHLKAMKNGEERGPMQDMGRCESLTEKISFWAAMLIAAFAFLVLQVMRLVTLEFLDPQNFNKKED